jgi:hypothetical protein
VSIATEIGWPGVAALAVTLAFFAFLIWVLSAGEGQ